MAEDHLLAVRENRFDHLRLAAQVHVRLEVFNAAGAAHHVEVLRDADRVRRDVEGAVAALDAAVERQRGAEFRRLALRVEVDAQLHVVGDVLAAVAVVDVPADLRSGQHQLAGVGAQHFALLVDGPFHEQAGARIGVRVAEQRLRFLVVLHQVGERVVSDLAALDRRGAHLNGAHPAGLGEAGVDDGLVPRVHRAALLRVLRRADDQIRFLAEFLGVVPAIGVDAAPVDRLRHVRGVALRRTIGGPRDDGVDFLLRQ